MSNDLDINDLETSEDFADAQCLLNSEVALVLNGKRERMEDEQDLSTAFLKVHEYVKQFNLYNGKSAAMEVRRLLASKSLNQYQLAALANLCPEKSEEAKELIPSLNEFDDEELDKILSELQRFREYTHY